MGSINSASLHAYAKINLTLDVGSIRPDGYHEITSVMQTIDLADDVTVELNDDDGITIECNNPDVPCDSSNIAYKCARAILDRCKSQRGCLIKIEKNIPMQAGLGGGSADGAAVLMAINLILGLGLRDEDLMSIGAQFGADVPFCVHRSAALCEGIGDIVTSLPKLKEHHVVIVKPNFGISTPEAYKLFDQKKIKSADMTPKMVRAMMYNRKFYPYISNDLERAIDNDEIKEIKQMLIDKGAAVAEMTGSGSAVYGLFTDEHKAFTAYLDFCIEDYDCYCSKTL